MLIDVHCHLFTKSMIEESILQQAARMSALGNASARLLSNHEQTKKLLHFLQTAFLSTPEQHLEYMGKSYGRDFIAVPLMLDLSYALDSPLSLSSGAVNHLIDDLQQSIEEEPPVQSSARFSQWTDSILYSLRSTLKKADPRTMMHLFDHSYERQLNDLVAVKKQMPDRVFPFFSIDPRRDALCENGIMGEVKRYVGRGKPFTGIKLYPSLGYSPTDPLLYSEKGEECLFSWCERHAVPITAHCAPTGFSHFVEKVPIRGDIYFPPAGQAVSADALYDDGIVVFKKKLPFDAQEEVIFERLLMLTHPVLWRKVLNRYPKLKLNLAHLGGSQDLIRFSQGDPAAFWTQQILRLMSDFENVYTDLSCFTSGENNQAALEGFYSNIFQRLPKKIQSRIMFGSDYIMLALFESSLSDYLQLFESVFGRDFAQISEVSSAAFLGLNEAPALKRMIQRLLSRCS